MRLLAVVPLAVALASFPGDLTAQTPVQVPAQPAVQVPGQPDPAPGRPAQFPPRDRRTAEPAPTGTSVIRGRVVGAESGQPLRGARVTLSAPGLRESRAALTDGQGAYEIKDLPAGRYTLGASKGGYVNLSYGQRRPFESPRPIELGEAQVLQKIDFNLPRGGVIAGQVTDEFGEPVTEAMVQVGRLRFTGGRRQFTIVGRLEQTDDLGQFRVYGLPPGDYYVSAGTTPGTALQVAAGSFGYATTYYPGTPSIGEAQAVTLGIGQEIGGVVFSMLRARTAKVTGTVLDSSGKPLSQVTVMVLQSFGGGSMMTSAGAGAVRPDGSFTLSNLTPGDYTIQARGMSEGSFLGAPGTESASVNITVAGEDITGLLLVMSKGGIARGRILFDSDRPPASLVPGSVRVAATAPAPGGLLTSSSQGTARDDWTFELTGVTGERLIRATVPGWYLKSITLDGADLTDGPIDFGANAAIEGIEVHLTQQQSSVSGTVKGRDGKALKDYVVVIFAEDAARWGPQTRFVRSGRPDQDGRYEVRGLPAERYLAAAVEYLEAGEEANPDTLDQLRTSAARFSLGDAESKVLDLELDN